MGEWFDDVLDELFAQAILLGFCFLLMTGVLLDVMMDAAKARDANDLKRQAEERGRITTLQ